MKYKYIAFILIIIFLINSVLPNYMYAQGEEVYELEGICEDNDIIGHWAFDEMANCLNNGIFIEANNGIYGPNNPITRGLFVSAMGRMTGVSKKIGQAERNEKLSVFKDVSDKSMYFDYVQWAYENGIVNGTGNDKFSPNNFITREQMAVIISNFLDEMNIDLPETVEEVIFEDQGNINEWAKDAVKKMQMTGVLKGVKDKEFAPQKTTTRAEIATVLTRLSKMEITTGTGIFADLEVEPEDKNIFDGVDKETIGYINQCGIYGKSLNIKGGIVLKVEDGYEYNLSLVLKNTSGEEFEYGVSFEREKIEGGWKFTFDNSILINKGIDLDKLYNDQYLVLLKICKYDTYETNYYRLSNSGKTDYLEYYTITKNKSNNRINIEYKNKGDFLIGSEYERDESYMEKVLSVVVKKAKLPENVYDIVLDPGHGGEDPGAVYGKYYEKNLNLNVAMKVKTILEEKGYKVYMTRTGDIPKEKYGIKNIYSENGRINSIGDSKGKLCISIHANSTYNKYPKGGVEVYCPNKTNTTFASGIVDEILDKVNTKVGVVNKHNIGNGIYSRTFTAEDVLASRSARVREGFAPYSVSEDTNYYYIIRETGGIYTGAMIDGREKSNEINRYCYSKIGIETYIVEMGYMNNYNDLNNMLKYPDKYAEAIANGILEYMK